jgi:hypothetical protein
VYALFLADEAELEGGDGARESRKWINAGTERII